ncbi:unnamed protein product [Schistocephalus solidus]|uniref:Uncharacterized protein n=1 Tax=Schistocephalus solidus TaxID=70667 RepID=A0A183T8C0_SCHSO|nr:unnamed protein product [Schistocephalus solidus]
MEWPPGKNGRQATTQMTFLRKCRCGCLPTGGQKRRYKDTLKKSLKQLQINPATWEDLARNRPTWRRSVKTGSAIYEANRIVAAKAKRAA